MSAQVVGHVRQSPVEVVNRRQKLPQQVLARSLAVLNPVAVYAALVIEKVGAFALELLQARVFVVVDRCCRRRFRFSHHCSHASNARTRERDPGTPNPELTPPPAAPPSVRLPT